MCIFVITKFKLFERRIYSDKDLSIENKEIYDNLKLKVGDPVRLKNKDVPELIFYIDWIDIQSSDNIWYHIKDDKYIYAGLYQDFQLEKISEEETMQLKYNL